MWVMRYKDWDDKPYIVGLSNDVQRAAVEEMLREDCTIDEVEFIALGEFEKAHGKYEPASSAEKEGE
jgi:hypothetical protein